MRSSNERGLSLILLAVSLTAMLGFLALTVDVGRWYVARQKAVNVCDMAALGAATELSNETRSSERALSAALAIIDANAGAGASVNVSHVVGTSNPDVLISHYNDTRALNPSLAADVQWTDSMGNAIPRPAPNRGLIIRGRVPVAPVFGRVLGDRTARDIHGQTIVVLGAASRIVGGILPFGVSKDHVADLESFPSATVEHPLTYRSWKESWTGAPGAFGTLGPGQDPGNTSASALDFNITWGYVDVFRVGDLIPTTNGNMTGALNQGVAARLDRSRYSRISDWLDAFNSTDPLIHQQAMDDSRLVLIPIIDPATVVLGGDGTAQTVQIHGFATYAISDWRSGTKQVLGYFVKAAYEGSVGAGGVNYGTLSYHLL